MALIGDNLQDTASGSYPRIFSLTTFSAVSHQVLTGFCCPKSSNSSPSSSLCIYALVQTLITSLLDYFNWSHSNAKSEPPSYLVSFGYCELSKTQIRSLLLHCLKLQGSLVPTAENSTSSLYSYLPLSTPPFPVILPLTPSIGAALLCVPSCIFAHSVCFVCSVLPVAQREVTIENNEFRSDQS